VCTFLGLEQLNFNHWSKNMAKPPRQSVERGRDAKTGHFIPVDEARRRPTTTVVERVPLPGKAKK